MHATDKIINRIRRAEPGWAFTPKDFLDLGSRGIIDMTLSALARKGTIRRIDRGLYDTPKTSSLLGGVLSPDLDQVARAIARRFRWRIIPEGTLAANMLGLSAQVPAKIIYISDGPSTEIQIGKQTIVFKHARPKRMKNEGESSSLVIEALRHLGKDAANSDLIDRLEHKLSKAEKRELLRDARYSADWIYEVAQKIAEHHS